jgi:hypothetical protein
LGIVANFVLAGVMCVAIPVTIGTLIIEAAFSFLDRNARR